MEKITEILMPFLTEFKTTDTILEYLAMNGLTVEKRAFQQYVTDYNDKFDGHQPYLASTSNGYKFTTDRELIKRSLNQRLGKFVSGIKNIKKTYKVIGNLNQLSLLDHIENDTEALMEDRPEKYEEIKIGGCYW